VGDKLNIYNIIVMKVNLTWVGDAARHFK